MEKMREVVIIYHNHLDPEWARCYAKPLYKNAVMLRSYADVWEYIINTWLSMAEDGYQYSEGQYIVWRTYLERYPERKEYIKKLIREKKLEILLQGELTPETNYVPAEGLSRNYLLAKEFYDEFCGDDYEGTKIAWIWDAFGNSANMPQVLKLAGAEMVGGTKYRVCKDDFWVGIDGTRIPCVDKRLQTDSWEKGGSTYYGLSRHAHCKNCGGYGCTECHGTGMVAEHNFTEKETLLFLEEAAKEGKGKKFVLIGGEEVLPNQCILKALEQLNKKYTGLIKFRFGDISEYWNDNKNYYEQIESEYQKPTEDLNPVHQGCYVTRIENKQRVRKVTYKLLQAEAKVAKAAWTDKKYHKNDSEFTQAWQDLMLNMHHDSISGAHIDSGQDELMDYLDEAESIADKYVLRKNKVNINRVLGKERGTSGIHKKCLGKMEIFYDRKGITSVLKNGKDLFGDFQYNNMTYTKNCSGPIHIGELLLQCEWGDNHNAYFLGDYVTLGDYNYAVYEEEFSILWRGRHEAADPGVRCLDWEMKVEASDDGERLDFYLNVNWDTSNKRLRVAIPVADDSFESDWEIPYGFIQRSFNPDDMVPFSDDFQTLATRSIGEFPALHWVRHKISESEGIVILNKGIPSVKWIPGCFEMSLLRSPTMTGDTVLPSVDEIWDVDGVRDAGKHKFEFSIWPYTEKISCSEITKEGYKYNEAMMKLPFSVEGDIVVTAFKLAEDGKGCILRINEANGTSSKVKIIFSEERYIQEVDLMERGCGEICFGVTYEKILHKHQIATFYIR